MVTLLNRKNGNAEGVELKFDLDLWTKSNYLKLLRRLSSNVFPGPKTEQNERTNKCQRYSTRRDTSPVILFSVSFWRPVVGRSLVPEVRRSNTPSLRRLLRHSFEPSTRKTSRKPTLKSGSSNPLRNSVFVDLRTGCLDTLLFINDNMIQNSIK